MFGIDDIILIGQLIDIVNEVIDEQNSIEKSKELEEKIHLILSKIDDLVLREFRAANNMLSDLSSSPDLKKDNHGLLSKTEDLFLKNIGLNPEMKTGSLDNTTIIALSYLGMFRIGLIKKYDKALLTKYILRMYETGEHFIRADIFPKIYDNCFKKYCADIVRKHQKRKENLAKPLDYAKAGVAKAGQLCTGIGAFFVAVGSAPFKVPSSAISHQAKQAIQSLERTVPKVEYFMTLEAIDKECEREIDLFCSELAKNALNRI